MTTIKKIFTNVKNDYTKTKFILIFIESAIVLASCRIVLFFLPEFFQNQTIIIPLSLAVVYLLIATIVVSKKFTLRFIESRVDNLDEILTTVSQIKTQETLPAQAAREELIERAKETATTSLFEFKKLYVRTLVLFLLIASMTLVPFVSNGFELHSIIPFEEYFSDFGAKKEIAPDNVTLLDDAQLYGEKSTFADSGERIEITVDLSHSGGDYANPLAWDNEITDDARENSIFADAQIENPAIEKLPEEIELAKAYNLKIRQIN